MAGQTVGHEDVRASKVTGIKVTGGPLGSVEDIITTAFPTSEARKRGTAQN